MDKCAERLKMMEGEEPVFVLFEGVCPKCGNDAYMVSIGGTADFLENNRFSGKYNVHTWNGMITGSLTDGQIDFECPEGHCFSVAHNTYGDWNM